MPKRSYKCYFVRTSNARYDKVSNSERVREILHTVNFPVLDFALFWIISRVLPTQFYKSVTNETKHTCSERAFI